MEDRLFEEAVLVLRRRSSSDDVRGRSVSTFKDHLAVEAANEGSGFPEHDAEDERRRTLATFDSEQAGEHVVRFVAFDGDRAVAWPTLPSHRSGST